MIFLKRSSPLVSTAENSLKRLISYHIAVWFMVFVGLILQTVVRPMNLLFGLAQVALAFVVSVAIVFINHKIRKQPTNQYIDYLIPLTYGLLTALLLPAHSPFYIIILAIILIHLFEALFKKLFKKNIMHPVLLSILVVQLIFRESLTISETMINIFQSETLELGRIRLFIGAYEGLTLGTTAFLVLGFVWVYLSVTKIIDFKMSLHYAIHLLLYTLVGWLFTDTTFWLLFSNLILGYTLLTMVFFIAEPTATPETREMMWLFPFFAAMFTLVFRLRFNIIEAPLYAVLFAQFIIWIIEQFQTRTTKMRTQFTIGFIVTCWIVLLINIIVL